MRGVVFALAFAAIAACNPYDPDLPPEPFQCGAEEPRCPGGYTCDTTTSPAVCIEGSEDGADANNRPDGIPGVCTGVGDPAEPNNMMNMPTQTSVADSRTFIELVGVTVCPAGDVDYYFVNIPTNGPNLDVTITFDPTVANLSLRILNNVGTPVANGGTVGGGGTVKAVLNNAAQGQYYAVVQGMPGETNSYSILIDTRRL